MVPRKIDKMITRRLDAFPAVALLGPRQAGKTTLARTFSDRYYDLELESEKLRLDLQWDEIVGSDGLIILDEAQNNPEIFPKIRHAIDADRKRNGRFLILGSVSPGLMKQVSEYLTGRIALTELSPISLFELENHPVDDFWLMGGFPDGGILDADRFGLWQKNYLDILAMRDLPEWGMPASPGVIKRFFKMLAASHGTLWNASMLGKSLGLSYHTVNTYLDYLEQTFLINKLEPYHANIKKRLIKRPKIYWRDSGLLHSLLMTGNMDELIAQPWVGLSWEGWVIEQIITGFKNRDLDVDPYFFRTSDGLEIDLLLVVGGSIWAFEIKLTSHPERRDLERLAKAADLINADKLVLLSRAKDRIVSGRTVMTDIRGLPDLIPTD